MNSDVAGARRPGIPQGLTVVTASFLPILAIVSMFPAVPSIIDHYAADPGASWKVPWMVTAPGLSIALLAPIAGIMVDRFGRRRLLLWATFLYGVMGVAPFIFSGLTAIIVSRLLLGACEAALLTVLNTLIGDYFDERRRRHWLGIQGAIGPFLASGLILVSGYLTGLQWNGVFLVYLSAFPIWLAMLAFVFEPSRNSSAEPTPTLTARTAFPTAIVTLIGVVTLFSSIIFYVFIVNGGLAFREVGVVSPERLAQISVIPSLFVCVGAGLFWLTDRLGSAAQIALTLALVAAGYAIMGLAPDWRVMAAGLCVQQAGMGMVVPSLIAWAQRMLPFEHRGRGMGIWSGCFFLGQFVSPPLVALTKEGLGTMQAAFVATGALSALGAVAVLILVRDRRAADVAIQSYRP